MRRSSSAAAEPAAATEAAPNANQVCTLVRDNDNAMKPNETSSQRALEPAYEYIYTYKDIYLYIPA